MNYIASFAPNGDLLTLSPDTHRTKLEIELYEGQPATQLYLGGSPGSIGLGGIRGKHALLFVEARSGFVAVEQYRPRGRKVQASTVAVLLGGYRDIVVDWDRQHLLYRLTCTRL
jgi:hypothetical protein